MEEVVGAAPQVGHGDVGRHAGRGGPREPGHGRAHRGPALMLLSGALKAGPSKPVSIQWLALVWSPEPWLTVRSTASRSINRACSGNNSPKWTPGHACRWHRTGRGNPPAASGLGSQVSMWPGPPLSQNRMTLVSFRSAAAPASRSRKNPGRARPPTPSIPACTKLRRVIPHNRWPRRRRPATSTRPPESNVSSFM